MLTSGTGDTSTATKEVKSTTTTTGYMTEQDRPAVLTGVTRRVRTGHGNMYITVTDNKDGRPFEMFSTLGKAGGCDAAQHEAIGRLASLAMRSGVDPDSVVESLRGITCCPTWDDGVLVRSGPDAMAIALDKHLKNPLRGTGQLETREPIAQLGMSMPEAQPILGGAKVTIREASATYSVDSDAGSIDKSKINQDKCPDCAAFPLAREEGCAKCYSCGNSRC